MLSDRVTSFDAVSLPTHLPRDDGHSYQPQLGSHLSLLQFPSTQKRLIHHWVVFTSKKLVLIDEPHNPCRCLMLPMALQGVMSDSDRSTADIATFHAICACAAYNLYELSGRKDEQDRVLALTHHEQAIQHLRHNLDQADQHRDQSFAMAIMACITAESVSGNTQQWRAHVTGGLAYLIKLRSKNVDPGVSSPFHMHMVSMAILCGVDVPSELKSFLHGKGNVEGAFPYYGASISFLRRQDQMNTLASGGPSNLSEEELDAFELQAYLDFPPAPSTLLPRTQAIMLASMAQAFFYASIVFFQRSVRNASLDAVQTLVENGIQQLEAIETTSEGLAGSVMMWPALVLASECSTAHLQGRILCWFQAKQKLGFRNITVLKGLVEDLWGRRACGEADCSWQQLIVDKRYDVFRL